MAEANSVSFKLPAFWTSLLDQPTSDLVSTSGSPVHHPHNHEGRDQILPCCASLDQDAAGRLLDLLCDPPNGHKYEAIKTRLTKTFGLTCRARANRLLQMGDLGDRPPSALMDEVLALLDGDTPCMLFEQLFLNTLSASSWLTPISQTPARLPNTRMNCGFP